MARHAQVQAPVMATDITGNALRELMNSMSQMLKAIGDGQITVDGQPVGAKPPTMPQDGRPEPVRAQRPTIQELRAQGIERARAMGSKAFPQTFIDTTPPAPVAEVASAKTPAKEPRVVYALATPGQRIDASSLSPAGVAILKYLATQGTATIMSLMTTLELKRSTIANVLTELRRKNLVVSKGVK